MHAHSSMVGPVHKLRANNPHVDCMENKVWAQECVAEWAEKHHARLRPRLCSRTSYERPHFVTTSSRSSWPVMVGASNILHGRPGKDG